MGVVTSIQDWLKRKVHARSQDMANELAIKRDISAASADLERRLPQYVLRNKLTGREIFTGHMLDCVDKLEKMWPGLELSAIVAQGIEIVPRG